MPIKMMQTDRGAGPVIVCDFCGERITEASEANYIRDDEGVEAGSLTDIYFVHNRRRCDEGLQRQMGMRIDNSAGLPILIPYLIHNLNVDMEHAAKYAAIASEEIG